MEAVDVLGDKSEGTFGGCESSFEFCERVVALVWFARFQLVSAVVVPACNGFRISAERFGCCEIFGFVVFPVSCERIAEGRDSGLSADTRACEYDEVACLRDDCCSAFGIVWLILVHGLVQLCGWRMGIAVSLRPRRMPVAVLVVSIVMRWCWPMPQRSWFACSMTRASDQAVGSAAVVRIEESVLARSCVTALMSDLTPVSARMLVG